MASSVLEANEENQSYITSAGPSFQCRLPGTAALPSLSEVDLTDGD
jgi:hypothetical protein